MQKSKSAALSMIAQAASAQRATTARKEQEAVQEPVARRSVRAPIREDRVNISAWLPKAFKKGMRSVQALDPDKSAQDLIAEALNDLFSKYKIPTVSEPARPGPRTRSSSREPD